MEKKAHLPSMIPDLFITKPKAKPKRKELIKNFF